MPKIPADKLETGMKLAKPLTRGNMILLGEGTELTEKWIEKIRDMNIESVFIDGPSQHNVPKDEMLAQLDRRFKNVENKPHMNLIKKLVKKHIEGLYG